MKEKVWQINSLVPELLWRGTRRGAATYSDNTGHQLDENKWNYRVQEEKYFGTIYFKFRGGYNKFRNYRSLNPSSPPPPPPPPNNPPSYHHHPQPPRFSSPPLHEDAIKRRENSYFIPRVACCFARNSTHENLLVNKLSVAGHRRLFTRPGAPRSRLN